VPVEPFATLAERLVAAVREHEPDLVYVSQVLFNSGFALADLNGLVTFLTAPARLIVIDGYHGFLARPTNLAEIADRAFYIAGGYKYAMAGEGVCFLHCPPGYGPRPRDTGWFAEFGGLAAAPGKMVGYPTNGSRFLGATFDPVGMYRLRAVLSWMTASGLEIEQVHAHATALMTHFLDLLEPLGVKGLTRGDLITPLGDGSAHGNFLSFRAQRAGTIIAALAAADVQADHRGDCVRFGFGLATTLDDVKVAIGRMAEVLARL
jgi:selenocysteine lyase/cysteine desulfurase